MTVTSPTPSVVVDARPGRARTIALRTLQILLGVFFIVASATPKLVGQRYAVEIFDEIGWGQWYRYLVGVVELAGGIGLLIPRLAGLAAAGLSVLCVLAAATQLFQLDSASAMPFPLVLAVVFAGIAWVRRDEIAVVLRR